MKTAPDSSGEESVEVVVFPAADGIPNSHLPLLIHHQAFSGGDPDKLAGLMEQRFADNGWTGAWRDGVYTFRHYHSNTHEVLGVFQGRAVLELGGDGGGKFEVSPGDVIVIPAGVSHQLLKSSEDFQVVGAYPNGWAAGTKPITLRWPKASRTQFTAAASVMMPSSEISSVTVSNRNEGPPDRAKSASTSTRSPVAPPNFAAMMATGAPRFFESRAQGLGVSGHSTQGSDLILFPSRRRFMHAPER